MPYVVVCPNCPARLKSQQPVPTGKTITCPQCKNVFTLTEPAPLVSDGSVSLPNPVKPKPNPDPRPNEPEVVDGADFEFDDKPKSKGRREDDDDDRPRSKKRRDDDDFDDRPRGKKSRDDDRDRDEDRRPAKGPADDFSFDDKPKSKRRRDDDDDFADDRPRGKKRRDDDDDRDRDDRSDDDFDDDRPRKKKGKSNNKLLLLGVIGGVGAFVMLGVLLLVLNLAGVFTLFEGGGASSDMMAWLPSETVEVEGFDLTEVAKNSVMLKSAKDDLREIENSGIKVEEMASSVAGRKSGSIQDDVVIVKLKERVDKDRVTKAISGQEMTANGKRYLKTKSNGAVFFAGDRLVIFTKAEATMTSLLTKDDGKVVIPDDMKKAVTSASGHMWVAAVGNAANKYNMAGGLEAPKPSMVVMNGRINGSNMDIRLEMTHTDAANAKKAAEMFTNLITLAKTLAGMGKNAGKEKEMKMFENAKASTSGNTVTVEMTTPITEGGPFK